MPKKKRPFDINDRLALLDALRDARRRNDYECQRKITVPLERRLMREADEELENYRHHVENGKMSTADFFALFKPKYSVHETDGWIGGFVAFNEYREVLWMMYGNGKVPEDVIWCGNYKETCTWDEAVKLLKNIPAEEEEGSVGEGFMIVGHDWWINKIFEPGSVAFELKWVFHSIPRQPEKSKKLKAITLYDRDDY